VHCTLQKGGFRAKGRDKVDKEGSKTWEQRIAKGECQHRASLHQPSSKRTRGAGATQEGGIKVD